MATFVKNGNEKIEGFPLSIHKWVNAKKFIMGPLLVI